MRRKEAGNYGNAHVAAMTSHIHSGEANEMSFEDRHGRGGEFEKDSPPSHVGVQEEKKAMDDFLGSDAAIATASTAGGPGRTTLSNDPSDDGDSEVLRSELQAWRSSEFGAGTPCRLGLEIDQISQRVGEDITSSTAGDGVCEDNTSTEDKASAEDIRDIEMTQGEQASSPVPNIFQRATENRSRGIASLAGHSSMCEPGAASTTAEVKHSVVKSSQRFLTAEAEQMEADLENNANVPKLQATAAPHLGQYQQQKSPFSQPWENLSYDMEEVAFARPVRKIKHAGPATVKDQTAEKDDLESKVFPVEENTDLDAEVSQMKQSEHSSSLIVPSESALDLIGERHSVIQTAQGYSRNDTVCADEQIHREDTVETHNRLKRPAAASAPCAEHDKIELPDEQGDMSHLAKRRKPNDNPHDVIQSIEQDEAANDSEVQTADQVQLGDTGGDIMITKTNSVNRSEDAVRTRAAMPQQDPPSSPTAPTASPSPSRHAECEAREASLKTEIKRLIDLGLGYQDESREWRARALEAEHGINGKDSDRKPIPKCLTKRLQKKIAENEAKRWKSKLQAKSKSIEDQKETFEQKLGDQHQKATDKIIKLRSKLDTKTEELQACKSKSEVKLISLKTQHGLTEGNLREERDHWKSQYQGLEKEFKQAIKKEAEQRQHALHREIRDLKAEVKQQEKSRKEALEELALSMRSNESNVVRTADQKESVSSSPAQRVSREEYEQMKTLVARVQHQDIPAITQGYEVQLLNESYKREVQENIANEAMQQLALYKRANFSLRQTNESLIRRVQVLKGPALTSKEGEQGQSATKVADQEI